jgi:hypothetical protein
MTPFEELNRGIRNRVRGEDMAQIENGGSSTTVYAIVRRPGRGWRFVGCSTWQHDSGVRVHCLGMALMPDGTVWREQNTPIAKRYIGMAGGNRKRGLMMWALALHRMQERFRDKVFVRFMAKQEAGKFFPREPGIMTMRVE